MKSQIRPTREKNRVRSTLSGMDGSNQIRRNKRIVDGVEDSDEIEGLSDSATLYRREETKRPISQSRKNHHVLTCN